MAAFVCREVATDTGIQLNGAEKLAQALYRKSQTDFTAVCKKGVNALFNHAYANTPVAPSTSTHAGGKLRDSLRAELPSGNNPGVVGYTRTYAPHVEYGHRQQPGQYVPQIGKRLKANYVQGQHFLQRSVEEVQPIFIADCKEALKKK